MIPRTNLARLRGTLQVAGPRHKELPPRRCGSRAECRPTATTGHQVPTGFAVGRLAGVPRSTFKAFDAPINDTDTTATRRGEPFLSLAGLPGRECCAVHSSKRLVAPD
jgi:hypothetical protein